MKIHTRNWKNVDWYVGQEKSYIQETRKNKIGMQSDEKSAYERMEK